jgi:anti-sigma regulatory factor (Ser/Thr protein kinase)
MESYTFDLTGDGTEIEPLQHELQDVLRASGVRLKNVYAINLALGEWLENVIQHAFSNNGDNRIRVECIVSPTDVRLNVRDNGKPFDPTQFPAEQPKSADIFAPRGLNLIHKLMDTVSYQRADGWNVTEFTKQVRLQED